MRKKIEETGPFTVAEAKKVEEVWQARGYTTELKPGRTQNDVRNVPCEPFETVWVVATPE